MKNYDGLTLPEGASSKPPDGPVRHGHPEFYRLLDKMAKLHSDKNHDYAAGGNPMGNFYRVAKLFEMYPDLDLFDPTVVAIVYAMKQLDAALWMKSNGHTAKVEGIEGRLMDLAVYAVIAMVLEGEKTHEEELEESWSQLMDKVETMPVQTGIPISDLEPTVDVMDGENLKPTSPSIGFCRCKSAIKPSLNCTGGYFWVQCPTCKTEGRRNVSASAAIIAWNGGYRSTVEGHRC